MISCDGMKRPKDERENVMKYLIENVSYGIHPVLSIAPTYPTKKSAARGLSAHIRDSRADYRRKYPRGIGLKLERWKNGARLTFGVNLWEAWVIEPTR
jgi:hypothetical protein